MRYRHTILLVSDIQRSKRFYCDQIGLKVVHDFKHHVTFEGGLAIHDAEHYQRTTGKSVVLNLSDHRSGIYFETDDIIDDFSRLEKAGVAFQNEIEMQPWNQQIFRCFDPDKHLIEVGETMEKVILRLHDRGKNLEEIVTMTDLPHDYVELILHRRYGDRQFLKS